MFDADLWSSSSTYHLQYLTLCVLLEASTDIVQCGLDDHQMSRKIDLNTERESETIGDVGMHKLTPMASVLVETEQEKNVMILHTLV